MTDDLIPADVRLFILRNIESIAQLEALLLLRGNTQEEWTAKAVARRLYITEPETMQLLTRLGEQGFIVAEGDPVRYRFQPESEALSEMVARVAEIYARHLVPVTNLIHSRPRNRIQEFADAFKLRKDE